MRGDEKCRTGFAQIVLEHGVVQIELRNALIVELSEERKEEKAARNQEDELEKEIKKGDANQRFRRTKCMIIVLTEFHIVCDRCGINGNSDLESQFPVGLNPPTENPLVVKPNVLNRSETKKLAKEIGWKVGRKDYCPKCVSEILPSLK